MQKTDFKSKSGTVAENERFRLWLREQFVDRCKRNPSYSLRAFAKFLQKDPSSLSKILPGDGEFPTYCVRK